MENASLCVPKYVDGPYSTSVQIIASLGFK